MSCEDYENNDESLLVKAAARLALFLSASPIRRGAGLLPKSLRVALATVFSATARVLNF